MNRLSAVAAFLWATTRLIAADVNDPVADFLREHQPRASARGDDRFYSDDKVFRLDLDLNGDRQLETLISSSLDRDGKAGNVWTIYSRAGDALRNVGLATFNADHFYVGKIDEIGKSGLVTFRPAGGGEGIIIAYVFESGKLTQVQLGSINREDEVSSSAGRTLLDKYLSSAAIGSVPQPTAIEAADLNSKYGIQVQPKTYAEALREVVASQSRATPTVATQGAGPNGTKTVASAASVTESPTPASAAPDSAAAAKGNNRIWPWLVGIFAAVFFGFLVWKARP